MKRFESTCVSVLMTMTLLQGIIAQKPKMLPAMKDILIQESDKLIIECQGEGKLQFSTELNMLHVNQSEHHVSFNDSGWYTFTRPRAIKEDTGWYACAEEGIEILNDEQTIDHPDTNISWIYVYVNSSKPFATHLNNDESYAPLPVVPGRSLVIPCRPTSPGLGVTLEAEIIITREKTIITPENSLYDPKIGFIFPDGEAPGHNTRCRINDTARFGDFASSPQFMSISQDSRPRILHNAVFQAVKGHNLTLHCYIVTPVMGKTSPPHWEIPKSVSERRVSYDTEVVPNYDSYSGKNWKQVFLTLTVRDVQRTDGGEYSCGVKYFRNRPPLATKTQVWVAEPGTMSGERGAEIGHLHEPSTLTCNADGHPLTNFTWVKIGDSKNQMLSSGITSSWKSEKYSSVMRLEIRDTVRENNGVYECRAIDYSGTVISGRRSLTVREVPEVNIDVAAPVGTESAFLRWRIYDGNQPIRPYFVQQMKNGTGQWEYTSEEFNAVTSSYLLNGLNKSTAYRFKIAVANFLGDSEPAESGWIRTLDEDPHFVTNVSVIRMSNTSITIEWSVQPAEHRDLVHYYIVRAAHKNETKESTNLAAELNTCTFEDLETGKEYSIGVETCSNYTEWCVNSTSELEIVVVDKDPKFVPNILRVESTLDSVEISWSTPPAELRERVHQYKVQATSSKGETKTDYVNKSENSYVFKNLEHETSYQLKVAACSEYKTQCGNWSSAKDSFTVDKNNGGQVAIWVAGSFVTVLLFSTMIIWMRVRKRSEMAARRRFIQATIERFRIGDRDSLDPELDLAAQAELLPYNEKWEFPRKLLKLDKILGSGAFGTVKKAVARSICKGEKYSTVAVKMVRANHRLDHMMALQRELKILAHLGKHVNVVNLLGACTDNISYGELFVIVEFCRFGNLHDYLMRRRADFVDQIIIATGIVAGSSSGTDCVIPIDRGEETANSDGTSAVGDCSHSTEDSDEASEAADDPAPDNNSVEPVQMSRYEGDFTDADVEPIGTWDLLCWAWQISRGMKYLGSKRVVHGDLAARNILLSERNVVKICDFGLAKSLYAGDIYKKSGDGPLPVKWMAIESIKDRLFSVKSDVWSFGIVLWELFSLAETPYPGIANDSVYQKLLDGFRMERPKYATKYIHHVMRSCWDADPAKRPSFAELEDFMDDFLDDRAKGDYLDFDVMYAKLNDETFADGTEDVLAMSPLEYASTVAETTV